jgi:outer membrane protein assembly factor BamB
LKFSRHCTSQVAAADVVTLDNTGDLELLVGDMKGNLLCVSRSGAVLWDRQLPGSIGASPTVGDVDGDGLLDVVVSPPPPP